MSRCEQCGHEYETLVDHLDSPRHLGVGSEAQARALATGDRIEVRYHDLCDHNIGACLKHLTGTIVYADRVRAWVRWDDDGCLVEYHKLTLSDTRLVGQRSFV